LVVPFFSRIPLYRVEGSMFFYRILSKQGLTRTVATVLTLCAAWEAAPNAAAQDETNLRPVTVSVGGMLTPSIASGFQSGWDVLGGGGFAVTRWSPHRCWRLYFAGNFLADYLGVQPNFVTNAAKSNTALQGAQGAQAKFYSLSLDPTVRFGNRGHFGEYLVGGAGWLRRSIDFTGLAPQNAVIQPGAPSLLSTGSSSAAVDVGGGINWRPRGPNGFMVFGEVRYVRGLAINHNTGLLPVSVGFRW
jgi:hypothetical protein